MGLELETSRRAFPEAQARLAGTLERRVAQLIEVGWHGSDVYPETGSVALVRRGGPWDNDAVGDDEGLIGEVVRVVSGARSCYVYVLGAIDVIDDLSLSRRAFVALAPLYKDTAACVLEVQR